MGSERDSEEEEAQTYENLDTSERNRQGEEKRGGGEGEVESREQKKFKKREKNK